MNRLYKKIYKKGKVKNVLVSWIQRKCIICKRFLSKHQHKFCKRCFRRRHLDSSIRTNKKRYDSDKNFRKKMNKLSLDRYYRNKGV